MTEITPDKKPAPRRPRLRLPFEERKGDAGEWAYDHRVGLCVTLIAYLVIGIAFVAGKIVVGEREADQSILIDLRTLEELEAERDRLEEEARRREQLEEDPIDWRSVQNQASNENVLNEALRDDRGTQTAELNESARAMEDRMRANREAWEQGLAEEEAIRRSADGRGDPREVQDGRAKGQVTISYSLKDPVRTRRWFDVPAYLCESGGEVVVSITVNPAGEVIAARVLSGGDDCMRETALRAARNSLFNIDESAPARQTGTMTYLFIPQ